MKRSVEKELLATVRRLEKKVSELEGTVVVLKAQVAERERRIETLESALARAKKDSSTSSKPPSSDIVKPRGSSKGLGGGPRKRGAQPGHERRIRPRFPEDDVDEVFEYSLLSCPNCGGRLSRAKDAPRVVQQVDLPPEPPPLQVEEHRGIVCWCERCQRKHATPLPKDVEAAALVGARLTALVAYLKGVCHASFSTIRKYLRDVYGFPLSRGQLAKLVQKVSRALDAAYDELLAELPRQSRVNADETGHKENRVRFWTWCFRATSFVVFKISGSRGSDVLFECLGREFEGILGCDFFSAYRKYMKDCSVLVQFCLAHLIRDVRYLTTLRSPATVAYGQRLLEALRELFSVFHNPLLEDEPELLAKGLEAARARILTVALEEVPATREAQNLAKRFREYGEAYFRFITTPDVKPTNNAAEQAIRFVVIDRLITQGTRSERGRRWCERIWTVVATCTQQGRSVLRFLEEAVTASFAGRKPPSLLAEPP